MSKPTNSAARNAMTESERRCYDWGWADAEERIVKLIKDTYSEPKNEEWGSFEWTGDILELIAQGPK